MSSGIGSPEIVVVVVMLFIFIGPKEMITLFRHGYKWWRKVQKYTASLKEELFALPELQKVVDEVEEELRKTE